MINAMDIRQAICGTICAGFVFIAEPASSTVVDERQKILSDAAITLSQAMEAAQSNYKGFAIEGTLREKEGMYFYQIDVITDEGDAEVYINPANGVVIGADFGRRYNMFSTTRNQSLILALEDASITFKDAVSIALAHFTGIVFDIRLEEKLGRYVYEVGLFDGEKESALEIAIDSGEVVSGNPQALTAHEFQ